ncbi:ABC transporter permease [Paenibacillus sp. 2KB_20]|uniref:ABC transporter permease n=1 Tax=Paenibacillus sp. 2KB_20 TaxID=3232977 RepID=UPI003F9CBBA0
MRLQSESQDGGELVCHDMGLQLLFGFSLFLVMFTVGFKVNTITKDKASGVWNRLILSPVRKTEMYMGHLLYSSLIGVLQIIMVLIFRYGFGFSYGTSSCVKEDRRQEECRFVEIGKSPNLRNKIAEVAH